ncbi:hypothetical protein K474DRAFT_88684 [Panus rudis PR-1116 ss-1]|nr:hypothetical protein K474DRAFT_88684 [Panus rudis PR-1116 ss-1]
MRYQAADNMGRLVGRQRPIDLHRPPDTRFMDLKGSTQLYLVVCNAKNLTLASDERNWRIMWRVGDQGVGWRYLQLDRELGCSFYTNWGPYTKMDGLEGHYPIELGEFTLEQRQQWEEIASNLLPPVPHGANGSQEWIEELLRIAVERNLIDRQVVNRCLDLARRPFLHSAVL